jgi:hypothetical protein
MPISWIVIKSIGELEYDFVGRLAPQCLCSPRVSCWSIPNQGELRHVEDAAIVGDTVVIGYDDGPCQVSIISLTQVLVVSFL